MAYMTACVTEVTRAVTGFAKDHLLPQRSPPWPKFCFGLTKDRNIGFSSHLCKNNPEKQKRTSFVQVLGNFHLQMVFFYLSSLLEVSPKYPYNWGVNMELKRYLLSSTVRWQPCSEARPWLWHFYFSFSGKKVINVHFACFQETEGPGLSHFC